jgi:hypothetical protein
LTEIVLNGIINATFVYHNGTLQPDTKGLSDQSGIRRKPDYRSATLRLVENGSLIVGVSLV